MVTLNFSILSPTFFLSQFFHSLSSHPFHSLTSFLFSHIFSFPSPTITSEFQTLSSFFFFFLSAFSFSSWLLFSSFLHVFQQIFFVYELLNIDIFTSFFLCFFFISSHFLSFFKSIRRIKPRITNRPLVVRRINVSKTHVNRTMKTDASVVGVGLSPKSTSTDRRSAQWERAVRLGQTSPIFNLKTAWFQLCIAS